MELILILNLNNIIFIISSQIANEWLNSEYLVVIREWKSFLL